MPFADFCDMVKVNRFTFSHESVTCRRSPEVSLTAFDAQPPDLQPVPLMDMDFAVVCPLVQHRMPQIQFLYIGSRLCSALLSGPASRRVLFHPCASLSLHVHHVVKRTFTSKRSNMLGTHRKGPGSAPGPNPVFSQNGASSDSAVGSLGGVCSSCSLRSSLRTTSARMDHDVIFVVFDFLPLPLGCS